VLGSIEVDTRPPAIEDGSVDLVVTQPSGTAPVDEPPLAPGGRVDLAFRLDDLNATVERVALVSDDDGAADIVLGLLDQTSNAWSFGATLDVATTTGPHRLIVTAVDDVGNRVGIEVDTIDVVGAIESACVAVDAGGTPVCTDADGDGFFAPGEGCAPGQASDCDDTRAAVHPGAVEVAGDAIDDDCDGDAPSYDDAETAGLALFVRPGAPLDAPATRAAPSGDLVGVVARLPAGGVAYVQRGTFALGAASIVPGGSIVGGLDDAWRPSGERTLLQSDIGLDFAPLGDGPPALLRGVTVRGAWCRAADGHDGGLEVVDVEVVVDGRSGCNQWTGLFGPRLRVTDSVVDLRVDGADVRGIRGEDVRVVDSSVAVETVNIATGIRSTAGTVIRSRIEVSGDGVTGIILDGAVISSQIVLDSGDNVGFFGSAAVIVDGNVVHNDVIAGTDTAAVVVGIHTMHGLTAANAITVSGGAGVALRIDDLETPTVRVHGNAIDVEGTTCALRSGRSDRTCLPLESCAPCAAHGDNAVTPATPPAVSAIALGAPSTSAVGLEGACRSATAAAGAR
jgi:hypothetical protein